MKPPLTFAALLAACTLCISGCGQAPNSEPSAAGTAPPAGSPGSGSAGSKIRLVYWVTPEMKNVEGFGDRTTEYGDYEKIQAAEYTREHPNVEIEVQALASEELTKKVTTAIAAGQPPDILKDFLGRTSGYAHQDLLEDFTAALPEDEKTDYDPFYFKLYTINGKLHGLPAYVWANHIMLNRAIWEAEGKTDLLPKEDDGNWTFEQFLTAMRAVAKPGKVWPWWAQFASEQGDYCNYGFFWGRGSFMYTPGDYSKVAINSPEGAEALGMLAQMAKDGLIPPGCTTMPYSEQDNMIGKGQTAAWGDSLFAFQRLEGAKKEGKIAVPLKLQMALYPHEAGRKAPMPVGPTGFVVFKQKDEARRTAALEFARWLNRPEAQKVYCKNTRMFPTRKSTGDPMDGDTNYARLKRWMEREGRVDLGLTTPAYYKVRVAAMPHLQAAMLGSKTPSQALTDFEKEANSILAAAK